MLSKRLVQYVFFVFFVWKEQVELIAPKICLKYVSYAFLLTVLLILVSNEILNVVRTEFIAEKLYFFLWNNWKLCKEERIRENLLFSFVNSRNTYHFKNQIGPPSRIKTCNCSSRQRSCSHKKSHQKCISQPFYS